MLTSQDQQQRLREYAHPVYGYRRREDGEIEKDLFDGELPEGWFDSPADVDGPTADAPNGDGGEGATDALAPPYEKYNINQLRVEYKRRNGKGAPPSTSTDDFVKALYAMDMGVSE